MEIRPSAAAGIPAQKALWSACFGDCGAFIDLFYRHCAPEDVLVLTEDGVLRAMTALLPLKLMYPDGTAGKAGYLYALCTDPAARGRGFAGGLLRRADFYFRERGMDCAVTVPAEAGLFPFFGGLGFVPCLTHRRMEAERALLLRPERDGAVTPAEPEAYGRLRERLLAGRFHVSYDRNLLAFQRAGSRMFGGDLYRIRVDGAEGCAAAEYGGTGRVLVRELLMPSPYTAAAAALLARTLPASSYRLRVPSFGEDLPDAPVRDFAMVKWYKPDLARLWNRERLGYLGLGFD